MEMAIDAAALEKFFVGADVGDFALIKDDDTIGNFHKFRFFGNHDDGAGSVEAFDKLWNEFGGGGIKGGGDVVKKENFSVG